MFCVVRTVYITVCEFMFSMMLFSLIQWAIGCCLSLTEKRLALSFYAWFVVVALFLFLCFFGF